MSSIPRRPAGKSQTLYMRRLRYKYLGMWDVVWIDTRGFDVTFRKGVGPGGSSLRSPAGRDMVD